MRTACMFLLLLAAAAQAGVHAHTLARDGGVSAVLHVEPGDNPQPGEPARLYISFQSNLPQSLTDKPGPELRVLLGDEEVLAATLQVSPNLSASQDAVFPEAGIYTVAIDGKDFAIAFDLRVGVADEGRTLSTPAVIYLLLSFLAILAVLFFDSEKSPEKPKNKENA